ncbi:MAG: hypothetical protein LIP77_09710 [Planctomycetes bacterium]|nr:hypothetical protein [Planctomycetota bacterium]
MAKPSEPELWIGRIFFSASSTTFSASMGLALVFAVPLVFTYFLCRPKAMTPNPAPATRRLAIFTATTLVVRLGVSSAFVIP